MVPVPVLLFLGVPVSRFGGSFVLSLVTVLDVFFFDYMITYQVKDLIKGQKLKLYKKQNKINLLWNAN